MVLGEAERAGIPFRRCGRVLLGLGDPVGAEGDRVSAIWRLRDLAQQEGLDPAFWRAGPGLLKVYGDLGLTALPLGPDGLPLPESTRRGSRGAAVSGVRRRTRPDDAAAAAAAAGRPTRTSCRRRRELALHGPIRVGARARIRILDGDGINGGDRPGTGIPGKTEFPRGWSDAKIIREIESVANDPIARRITRPDGRIVAEARRDGVDIRVIIAADGHSIVTGHPTNSSPNALPHRG